jgi:NADH-quinone oxidoreductase subunit B
MSEPRRFVVAQDPEVALHVCDLGLACCAVEFSAAVARGLIRPAIPADPAAAVHVLVVSGTVTDVLAPGVTRAWELLPEPRVAMAFGACTVSGGPYWDSYCVTKGIDQLIPVSSYVPGCPPRPEALVDALVGLARDRVGAQP